MPVEATTPSLEALKAYSMGITTGRTKGDAEAIPFMKRALELDPNFAMAYVGLAVKYSEILDRRVSPPTMPEGRTTCGTGSVNARGIASPPSTFNMAPVKWRRPPKPTNSGRKAIPRDMVPHGNLGFIYTALGQYDKAIAETEAAQRLEPTIAGYGNLAGNYINVNRLKDARQTLQEAQQKNFDGLTIRGDLYSLAFLSGDTAEMERQVAWAAGRPGEEDQML